jgi:hypothetical protein
MSFIAIERQRVTLAHRQVADRDEGVRLTDRKASQPTKHTFPSCRATTAACDVRAPRWVSSPSA